MCWKIQDRRHIENKQIKYTSEKANNAEYSKTTLPYPGSATFYGTWPGNEMGLIL